MAWRVSSAYGLARPMASRAPALYVHMPVHPLARPPARPPVCPPIHPPDRSWTQVHIFILALVSMWAVADKTTGFYHTDLAGPIFRSAYDGRPGGADVALYIGIADGMSLALYRHRRRHATRAISASPTACHSRGCGRAGTRNGPPCQQRSPTVFGARSGVSKPRVLKS